MKKIALVTGATSGIGKAIAESLAKQGYNLIITGRREKLLSELAKSLEKNGGRVLPISFDVRLNDQVEQYLGNLPKEWSGVDILVNNAGLAVGLDPINQGSIDDWDRMIDTNVKGLLYVSRAISRLMIANGNGGHILNICSIAGKEVYPNGNVYCASKHAVDALSKGMRMDLVKYGIRVSQVCPGAVDTEFSQVRFKGDADRAANVYQGFTPLKGEDVADAIMFIIKAPAHVNINDLVIMPTAQPSAAIINRNQ